MDKTARQKAELAARGSYGRLLALLVRQSRDITAAEDALSSAFLSALQVWPSRGIPQNCDAWLMTAARNAMRNSLRNQALHRDRAAELLLLTLPEDPGTTLPDERLQLLFLCAHPALDPAIRTPLMLQTVLGLNADQIARAFAVAPATMGQRLSRAKAKIRDANLRYVLSDVDLTVDRLQDVLDAIYAAFATGWERHDDDGLAAEAIYLGRLLADAMPTEPETKGLLSLMLHCEARRLARYTETGCFVPLADQDHRLWKRNMIIEAEALLTAGSRQGRFGRYLCEAAIQSVHAQRPITGQTNYPVLQVLYGLLHQHTPSLGSTVSLAAVFLASGDLDRAANLLDQLPDDKKRSYQPYWVTVARLNHMLDQPDRAHQALNTALSLTKDPALVSHLKAMFMASK